MGKPGLRDLASSLGVLVALRHPGSRWTARAVKASWLLLGVGSERELALRWRKPRYRLMVTGPDGETVNWVREIDGKFIPICTRREGARRMVGFLLTHPDCTARLAPAALTGMEAADG